MTMPAPQSDDVRTWLTPFRAGILLLLIVLLGAGLRLTRLDQPAIWGDEAATFGRVYGSYQELLDTNATDGFTPLHYELFWWIRKGMPYWGKFTPKQEPAPTVNPSSTAPQDPARLVHHYQFEPDPNHKISKWFGKDSFELTPKVLRTVPAIAGILLVPAMYFLARQLFGRGVSLLAALLCATSAYALVYARDAKMYSELWLMVTLHAGCFFWWMRSRQILPWLCWTLTGVTMLGLQMVSGFVVAVELIIFFTFPKQHWLQHGRLWGYVAWALLLPVMGVWTLLQKRENRWLDAAIFYPVRQWSKLRIPPIYGVLITLGVFYFALWGPLGYLSAFSRFDDRAIQDNGEIAGDRAGIGWVKRYNDGRKLPDLLLFTTSAYLTGWEWPHDFPEKNAEEMVAPRTLRLMKSSTVVLICLLAIGLLPWGKILSPSRARMRLLIERTQLPRSTMRRRVLWLSVWLLVPMWIMYNASMQDAAAPIDIVPLVATSQPTVSGTDSTLITWMRSSNTPSWPRLELPRSTGPRQTPAERQKQLEEFRSKDIPKWAAAWQKRFGQWQSALSYDKLNKPVVFGLLGAAVAMTALIFWRRKLMLASSLRLLGTLAAIFVLMSILSIVVPASEGSVWMPRYLGVILPAVFMLMAVLIARQPSKILSTLTVMAFVIVNMMQFHGRVFGHSEPPVDRIAADVLASQADDAHTRTYTVLGNFGGAEPGKGMLVNGPGAYYLRVLSGVDAPQEEMFRTFGQGRYPFRFKYWTMSGALRVADDALSNPQIDRVIVWTSHPAGTHDDTDNIPEALGENWKRVSDEWIPIRDHWMWLDYHTLRRREYVRVK